MKSLWNVHYKSPTLKTPLSCQPATNGQVRKHQTEASKSKKQQKRYTINKGLLLISTLLRNVAAACRITPSIISDLQKRQLNVQRKPSSSGGKWLLWLSENGDAVFQSLTIS